MSSNLTPRTYTMTDEEIDFMIAPDTMSSEYLVVERQNRDDEYILVNPGKLDIEFKMGRVTLYKEGVLIKSYPAELIQDIYWLE